MPDKFDEVAIKITTMYRPMSQRYQIAQALRDADQEAREECAEIADAEAATWIDDYDTAAGRESALEIARQIRKTKGVMPSVPAKHGSAVSEPGVEAGSGPASHSDREEGMTCED